MLKKQYTKHDTVKLGQLSTTNSMEFNVEGLSNEIAYIEEYLYESNIKNCWIICVKMLSGRRSLERVHIYEENIVGVVGVTTPVKNEENTGIDQKIKIITKNKILKINQNF